MNELTPNQMKHLSEMTADEHAIEATLKVAISHHSNRFNQLFKEKKKFWDDIVASNKLDPSKQYKIVHKLGSVYADEVVEDTDH